MSARKEEWRDLPGYNGFYQVSDWGRIRTFRDKHHKGGRLEAPTLIKPTTDRNSTHIVIKWEGKQRTLTVWKAVALAFLGDIPEGWIAYHKDGNRENNALTNIGICPRSEHSKVRMRGNVAGWNRRPVLKIDRNLEIVEVYTSASAAARANGYRPYAMWRFCSLEIGFSVFAPDDFLYTFDDDKWLRKALERARAELNAMNARYNDPFTECYYNLQPEQEPDIDPTALWWSITPALAGGGTSDTP